MFLSRPCWSFPIHPLELSVGLGLVGLVLYDVFETVVVPRRTTTKWRLVPPLIRVLWPIWRLIGVRVRPISRREDFLGTFAPFMIVLILVVWVLALMFGFGLAFHAVRNEFNPPPEDFRTALYAAGTALLTIGYGDIVPQETFARLMALLAGGAGLAVVALVIALSFNLYACFARREIFVLLLDARAGAPPSGVTLLETFGERRIPGQLASLFNQYEAWTAELLDSHLAYPVLPFFRSSHEGQSWVSALGAVLDAATLLTTVVDSSAESEEMRASRAAAEMMYHTGCHALLDLTQLRVPAFKARIEPGIERGEFDQACQALRSAGYDTVCTDATWLAFCDQRGHYAFPLNTLAEFLATPPTLWIGDRTMLRRRTASRESSA